MNKNECLWHRLKSAVGTDRKVPVCQVARLPSPGGKLGSVLPTSCSKPHHARAWFVHGKNHSLVAEANGAFCWCWLGEQGPGMGVGTTSC